MIGLFLILILMFFIRVTALVLAYPLPQVQVTSSPSTTASSAIPSSTSRNWAGYVATNGQYSSVSGSWIVPEVNQNNSSVAAEATWVGIGGVTSSDLIQSGTQTLQDEQGNVYDEAFVEILPEASKAIPVTVKPGDSVSVSILETQPNLWKIDFTNNTNNQHYQTTMAYTSSLSSADWIEETPVVGRFLLPIANFGSVNFVNGVTVKNGQTETIKSAGAQAISMDSSFNQVLATPSNLTDAGNSFTVTRSSVPSTTPNHSYTFHYRGFYHPF
jgi:hypothetical protein